MPQHSPALGLSPVARALIAGTVIAVLPPPRRGRRPQFVTVTLSTDAGELAVLVSASHKIYARVASRARRGDFWVVEADLVIMCGNVALRARHLISNRDNYMPSVAEPSGSETALPATEEEMSETSQLGFASW